jgi:hypothetical protein
MTFGAIKTLDNKFISNNVVGSIYLVLLEVAAKPSLAELNRPLGDADTESLEKFIRSTIENAPGARESPPPNQP